MQLGRGFGLFKTVPIVFYRRDQLGRTGDGQPIFEWNLMTIEGCLIYVDAPETEEEALRYHSTDRLVVFIPKGNNEIDFTGSLVTLDNKVYTVAGNSATYMEENTPGDFNRAVYGYRNPEVKEPTLAEIEEVLE